MAFVDLTERGRSGLEKLIGSLKYWGY